MDQTQQIQAKLRNVATYLQLFEEGKRFDDDVPYDPARYMVYSIALTEILDEPGHTKYLHEILHYPCVREMREGQKIAEKIARCRGHYYPELNELMLRLCPDKED